MPKVGGRVIQMEDGRLKSGSDAAQRIKSGQHIQVDSVGSMAMRV